MRQLSEPDIIQATEVLNQVKEDWILRPGVTAVDIGYKWDGGLMTDQLAIRVHVARKLSADELEETELFPKQLNGIPVDVIQAHYSVPPVARNRFRGGLEAVSAAVEAEKEVLLGSSVGNEFTTAGTIGVKVIDQESGDEMILSNWHVLAGIPNIKEGTPIWQPGRIDGGDKNDTIAHLTRWVIGPYDAAVAKINNFRPVRNMTPDGNIIDQVATPLPGMVVWKYGRTTQRTEGFIDGINGTVPMPYPQLGEQVILQNICRILPLPGHSDEISMPGDSGAVWVDKATGKAVGLHCAGETGDQPEYSLAHDLRAVTSALLVKLPGEPKPIPIKPAPSVPPVLSMPTPPPPPAPSSIFELLLQLLRSLFGNK